MKPEEATRNQKKSDETRKILIKPNGIRRSQIR
jgi:hypothetical protein